MSTERDLPPPAEGELYVVVGPTTSGKTELALRLAERFDGEIVGADSVFSSLPPLQSRLGQAHRGRARPRPVPPRRRRRPARPDGRRPLGDAR